MILSIDPGMTCGWAVVRPRTGSVVDVGLLESDRDPAPPKSADFGRRVAGQGRELRAVIARHGCTAIACEQALYHGPTNAVVPQVLGWGLVIGLAVELELELYEVTAKDWQRAMLDVGEEERVDYDLVVKQLAKFVAGQVADVIAAIAPSKRGHVYDAVGVGVYTALARPVRIIGARAR